MNTSYDSQRAADDADLAHPILHKVPSSAAFEVQIVLQPSDAALQCQPPGPTVIGSSGHSNMKKSNGYEVYYSTLNIIISRLIKIYLRCTT